MADREEGWPDRQGCRVGMEEMRGRKGGGEKVEEKVEKQAAGGACCWLGSLTDWVAAVLLLGAPGKRWELAGIDD